MHVVVVDTNIIISTLLGKSYPYLITRELILKKRILCIVSDEVTNEYHKVISYEKFRSIPKFKEESIELIDDIQSVAVNVRARKNFSVLKDKDDNKFLDLAYASNADFLITGNTKHFPFGKFENTEIISPQKYWTTYWK
ncbi:MAG: putative toxin-antitoxin system toxin component, PIN family [Bacteroidetes bacterium]|nr:putative toxin-antitoxin system toxin component, PIN family [Bacteroidota bacterium]MBI3482749.1 putative toxin-antitoxin system toxin component, PIN family [Bacteroidota bacterium]